MIQFNICKVNLQGTVCTQGLPRSSFQRSLLQSQTSFLEEVNEVQKYDSKSAIILNQLYLKVVKKCKQNVFQNIFSIYKHGDLKKMFIAF